jgi:serine/threonine protein kinase
MQDGAFSEREAAKLVRKITEALQYLHSRKVFLKRLLLIP